LFHSLSLHDALPISLLRRWLDEDREGLQIHRRLTDDSNEWLRFERDSSLLYRGARLHAAHEWADERHAALSPTEREFLDASLAADRKSTRLNSSPEW